ncbi:hypothetical protein [Flaviflagellibacter deserti]|uniref:Uncharacterized protein n=1 Tax=Flaviflagellibacter deserti TaxID=2267266 RepID=A0ABV9Z594_9HYPH
MGQRAGRKRGIGERYKSGDLKPAEQGFAPAEVRHMVDAARAKVIDGCFGTTVGRLRLEAPAEFTDELFFASRQFAAWFAKHDRLMGMNRPRTAKSPDYSQAWQPSISTTPDETDVEEVAAARREMAAVVAGLGEQRYRVVYNSVLLDLHCNSWEREALRSGLEWLAIHFGMARLQRAC